MNFKWILVRTTPISQLYYSLAGFLYVDNTDLVAMNNENEIAKEVVERAQKLLDY